MTSRHHALRRGVGYAVAAGFGLAGVKTAFRGSWSAAHGLAAAATGVLLVPTLWRNCSLYGPVVKRFMVDTREAWLTIDDGPDPEDTPEILDVLARHGAKATFFAIGERVLLWPNLACRVVEEGHRLENHTQHHQVATFWAASPRRAHLEIDSCTRTIQDVTGTRPSLFRCPVGLANPFVHEAAMRSRLRMIGWSAAALDGVAHSSEAAFRRIKNSLFPGAIILLHEGPSGKRGRGSRAAMVDRVLQHLERENYVTTIPY